MTKKSYWKMVPLAAFLAVGLFMFSAAANLPVANAEILEDLDAEETTIGDGDFTTVTFSVDPDDGDVEITLSGVRSDSSVRVFVDDCDGCDGEGDSFDNEDSGLTISFSGDESGDVVLEVETDCEIEDSFTLRVVQDEDADTISLTCDPDASGVADGNVIVIKEAAGASSSEDFDFTISGTGTECDRTFSLGDNEEEGYNCREDGTYTITESTTSGWTLIDITCTDVGIPNADVNIEVSNRRVTFTLGTGDSIECTFVNEKSGTATPTATATAGVPGAVTVQAVPNAVNCNGSSFITVVVRTSAGGQPVDGALVNISTTLGSVSPGQATTSNGSILTIFTAPANNGGTATINATSGGVSGTATIQVNCSAATAVPPTAVPTQPPAGPIRPPSTGDAGLVSAEQGTAFGWEVVAAAAAVTAALVGAVAVRRQAQA